MIAKHLPHCNDVMMGTRASQITRLTIVYSTVYSDADQRKHQSSASLAFVRGIHREFPSQMDSNAENVSIWWRHHAHIDYQPSYVCLHLKHIPYTIYKKGCHTVNENTECCRSVKQQPKPENSLKRNKCIFILKPQLHMMTSSNGNIFRVTGHLCGKFTGPRWISRTKASDAELWCFLWITPE